MKRFLSIVLCFVFALSLTACKDKSGNKGEHSVDIEYYAKLGRIADVEYAIGDDVASAKDALSKTLDEDGESMYFDYQSGEYTVMTDGEICYCYKTDNESDGITHIVKYGDAYGFKVGAISTTVVDTMKNLGFESELRKAKSGELFFLPSGADIAVLEYEIKENTVLFVFQEYALCATVIY